MLSIIVWVSVLSTVIGGAHYYIWARLVRDTHMPGGWRMVTTAMLIAAALLVPSSMLLRRLFPVLNHVVWLVYAWMGMMFILMMVIFSTDLFRWGGFALIRFTDFSTSLFEPDRRAFLGRALGIGAAGTAATLGLLATREAFAGPKLRRVQVGVGRLPEKLNGLRMVQISDLHIGPTIGRDYVEHVVERANELDPDIVAITGDLVDGSVERLAEAAAPLANLKSRYGVFFVTGNHEYYSGVEDWMVELERLGIKSLRNERVQIGEGDDSFYLVGIDDPTGHRFAKGHGSDLDKALDGKQEDREIVLLSHQPKTIDEAARHKVGLQISGHTHGGQIWPFGYIVRLVQPYVAGLWQHNEDTQIYVSCGTGYWGPPMRLAAPSELTCIELHRASS